MVTVQNTLTGVFHIVVADNGEKYTTACGLVVTPAKHYTGTERWIIESDAWDVDCTRCRAKRERGEI